MKIDGVRALTRRVWPNREVSPERLIAQVARSRVHYVSGESLVLMPRGPRFETAEEEEVTFLNFGHWISSVDVDKWLRNHCLRSADPWLTTQVNIDDTAFADRHPNCTQWFSRRQWHFVGFRLHVMGRVTYLHHKIGHAGEWWHAAVPLWRIP